MKVIKQADKGWRVAVIALLFSVVFVGNSAFTNKQIKHRHVHGWEHLGSKKVNFGLDKDVITITAAEGKFTKLKLKVSGGNLNMHKMVVVYGNGTRDNINVKHNFTKGDVTRTIDLNGNRRVVQKVIFWYDTKNRSRRKATLHLFGRH
ncbi:MAG: DUF2541 family protein [Bacteroidia bacterium]|nr:DUF2541 family protein [Bacteroidia bacterium]